MTFVISNNNFTPIGSPGFFGDMVALPGADPFLGDRQGSVPQRSLFDNVNGEMDQGLSLFAAPDPVLPFAVFNSDTARQSEINDSVMPSFMLDWNPLVKPGSPTTLSDPRSPNAVERINARVENVAAMGLPPRQAQAEISRQNRVEVEAQRQSAENRGFVGFQKGTVEALQTAPKMSVGAVLSELPGEIGRQTASVAKGAVSGAASATGFVISEIIAANLPLIILAGAGIYLLGRVVK